MKGIISALFITMLLSCSDAVTEESSDNKTLSTSPIRNQQDKNNKENNMFSLFGKKELKNYYISSPLKGLLVKDGIPMANAKIIRHLVWNGNEDGIRDEIFTDENGYFDISAHQEALSLSAMTQFVGAISLFVESESEDNCVWYSAKYTPENYSDIEKPLTGLVFDLGREENGVDIGDSSVLIRGSWDNMPGPN
jgi:hypothetical protein